MRGQAMFAVTALTAALMAAQPAMAQNYRSYQDEHLSRSYECGRQQNNSAVGGAIIGGILGAVVGSQVSGRGHRTDGSVVGGAVGAAVGAGIGNSSARRTCDNQVQGSYDPYYGQPQDGRYAQNYPQQPQYDPRYDQRDQYGDIAGGPDYGRDNNSRYRDDDGRCRWGTIERETRRGRVTREDVYMCRGRDGVWRIQNNG